MSRLALVSCLFLSACFGVGGKFVKDMANSHIITTGLAPAEFSLIARGAERHGCTQLPTGGEGELYACPEAKDPPTRCRIDGDQVRCGCTGDEAVCQQLVASIVHKGRAP